MEKVNSEFKSENFSRITCGKCGEVTEIEPGYVFSGLNCKCDEVVEKTIDNTEISTPVQEELDYIKTQVVIVIGRFDNGDYEVCNNNNLDDTWRVPKETFEDTYEVVITPPQTSTTLEYDKQDTPLGIKTAYDPINKEYIIEPKTELDDIDDNDVERIQGLTKDEIKAEYTVEQLKIVAKSLDIKRYSRMNENTLIERILEKVK